MRFRHRARWRWAKKAKRARPDNSEGAATQKRLNTEVANGLPGTKRRDHLADNIAAADIALSPSEVAALDAAAPPDFTAGDRYPTGQMPMVNI